MQCTEDVSGAPITQRQPVIAWNGHRVQTLSDASIQSSYIRQGHVPSDETGVHAPCSGARRASGEPWDTPDHIQVSQPRRAHCFRILGRCKWHANRRSQLPGVHGIVAQQIGAAKLGLQSHDQHPSSSYNEAVRKGDTSVFKVRDRDRKAGAVA